MSDTEDEGEKPEGPAKLGHRKVNPVTGEVAFKKVAFNASSHDDILQYSCYSTMIITLTLCVLFITSK